MTETLVVARRIAKRFSSGVEALRDGDWQMERGQFVSIVGPSGCGKSTLLRVVAGLEEPSGGVVTLQGRSPIEARRDLLDLAFAFQDAPPLPLRPVEPTTGLPTALRGPARPRPTADSEARRGMPASHRAHAHACTMHPPPLRRTP